MTASPAARPRALLAAAAVGAGAFLLGGLLAFKPVIGGGVLGGLLYAPLAMISVPLGVAGWIVIAFVKTIPGIATSAMLLVVAAAWLGFMIARGRQIRYLLPGQRFLVGALGLLLAWLTLSLVWAQSWEMGWRELRWWLIAAGLLLVVATAIRTPRQVRLILFAFVAGGTISVVLGWLGAGPHEVIAVGSLAARSPHRFTGAEGDPNELAEELIPAIVFALALAADRRRLVERASLIVATVVLTLGIAATQSRGGLVAAASVLVVTPLVFKRQRRYLLPALVLVIAVAGVWLVVSSQARNRVLSFNDSGAGRTTLWLVAWRIAGDYQPEGVGLNNFRVVAPRYVLRPGSLGYVQQITDQPHVVHNTYLELLAETGIVGLGLFLSVVTACLAAAARAAQIFDRVAQGDLARLSRAVVLAGFGSLVAQFFISNGYDWRSWALLALGPALLALARIAVTRPEPSDRL